MPNYLVFSGRFSFCCYVTDATACSLNAFVVLAFFFSSLFFISIWKDREKKINRHRSKRSEKKFRKIFVCGRERERGRTRALVMIAKTPFGTQYIAVSISPVVSMCVSLCIAARALLIRMRKNKLFVIQLLYLNTLCFV